MAAVEIKSRSICKEDLDEKWNEYARVVVATYIIVHRRGTGSSGEGKVIMGFAEPFHGQRGDHGRNRYMER